MKSLFLSMSALVALTVPTLSHSMFGRRFALPVRRLTPSFFRYRIGARQVGRCFNREEVNKSKIDFVRGLVDWGLRRGFNKLNKDLNLKNYKFFSRLTIVAHLDEIDACNAKQVEIDAEKAKIVSKAKKADIDFNQTEIDLLFRIITEEGDRSVQKEIKSKMGACNVEKTDIVSQVKKQAEKEEKRQDVW